ncbi:MAG: hypothetical protein IT343_21350 [Candidatus Melainabacteria bacterium]|jgi:hypothetical protein|nr:hypothetical protein [Candidatus Melainabacteria bacterium]
MSKLNQKELKKAHKDLQIDARQRVAERGVLQFRADKETILAILDAADRRKMPVGALLREWIQDKLVLEDAYRKSPDLLERITVLEQTVSYLQKKLK